MFTAGYIYGILLIILAMAGGVCGTISFFRSPKPPPWAHKEDVKRYYKEMPLFGTKKPSPWDMVEADIDTYNKEIYKDIEFYESQVSQLMQLQSRIESEHQKRPSNATYRQMITLDNKIYNLIKKINNLRDSLDI